MRKRIISITILLFILLSPFISWLFWAMQESKEFRVLTVDKTVLNTSDQEHISLDWILLNNKYKKEGLVEYDYQKDYYGFFPDDEGGYEIHDFNHLKNDQLDSMANYYDMVYYADLYGIYVAEWWHAYPEVAPKDYKKIPPTERSRSLYGGLSRKELRLLKEMKKRKKLIMTEFNIVGLPTRKAIRKDFEKEFSLDWSEWVGRYFSVLDTNAVNELPIWVKRNYVDQYGEWPFTKSGIVFVRTDDKIVILEFETHLKTEVPIIHTPKEYRKKYGLPAKMKYPFWFDIMAAEEPNTIISTYRLSLNEKGDSVLRVNNLPSSFPAIIRGDGDYPFYYFAGDFCDNPISVKSAKFAKLHWVSSFGYNTNSQERVSFFWEFYRPLTNTILNDYYETLNARKQ